MVRIYHVLAVFQNSRNRVHFGRNLKDLGRTSNENTQNKFAQNRIVGAHAHNLPDII
jgi:hypothetical protein